MSDKPFLLRPAAPIEPSFFEKEPQWSLLGTESQHFHSSSEAFEYFKSTPQWFRRHHYEDCMPEYGPVVCPLCKNNVPPMLLVSHLKQCTSTYEDSMNLAQLGKRKRDQGIFLLFFWSFGPIFKNSKLQLMTVKSEMIQLTFNKDKGKSYTKNSQKPSVNFQWIQREQQQKLMI